MSDLDPCPYCARDDFGNAGARQNHVDACGDTETEQEIEKEEVEERLEEKALRYRTKKAFASRQK